jgi:LysR family hydrogen peroxide-inducible transcriptional activator
MDVCMREGAIESPYRATSLSTLVQMVGAGLGVTLLPSSALAVESARAPVRAVPFREPAPGRTLRLVWPEHARRAPLLERVAERLAAAFRGR